MFPECRETDLISLSTPTGQQVVGPRYHTAAAEIGFRLEPEPDQPAAFHFVYYTDIHLFREEELGDALHEGQQFLEALEEMTGRQPAPAFLVSGGDIEIQAGMGATYREMLAPVPMPVYHVIGNHEMLTDEPDPRGEFERLFGPTRYSWNYGGAHFVVLDGATAHPEDEGWRSVHGEVTNAELDWLQADLQAAPEGAPVIAFVHIPPFSTFGARRGKPPGTEPAWDFRGCERLVEVLSQYNTRMVLAGHFHENEHLWVDGIEFIASGAICGHWWERGGRPPVNVDGSPKGYRLIYVNGDEITSAYQGTGHPSRYRMRIVGPHRGEAVEGRIGLGVNVFDADARWSVDYRLDAGDWRPLKFTPQLARPNVLSNAHFWAGYVDVKGLLPGVHVVWIRATGPSGEAYTDSVTISWRP